MFKQVIRWIPVALATVGLVVIIWAIGTTPASAQDGGGRTVAERVEAKTPALEDFESRLTEHNAIFGPFNITVSPTNKGANGFRFIDVPYIQFIGNSIIAFPNGKRDRFGNEWFLYASNFVIEVHPRTNPAERTR